MRRHRWMAVTAGLVALSLVAAACGDDDDDAGEAPESTEAPDGTSAPEATTAPDGTSAPDGTTAPDGTEWETSIWRSKTGEGFLPIPKRIRGKKEEGARVTIAFTFEDD